MALHEQQPSGSTAAPPSVPMGAHRPPDQWPTGRLFSAVARRLEREWNARLADWDLNHASLPVLYLLAGGPLSQRELALSSGVTEQTMSRILARLERQAYVERHTHATDRRRHEVHLTDAGRATLMEAGDPEVAERMSVRGLSAEQVETLRGLLLVMLDQGAAGRSLAEILDAADDLADHAAPESSDGAHG